MNDFKTKQSCIVYGHELVYHRAGFGEAVLLVHGMPTYSIIWRNLFDDLSNSYDVIAIDLLGCGDSDKPLTVSYSLTQHCHYLIEFINQLGIKKVHIVGHDVGGGICQIFAVKYPDKLHDLILINPVAYDFWPVQPVIAMRTPIIRQLAMAALDFGALKLIIKRSVYYKERITDELVELIWKPMKTKAGRKAILHFAKSLNNKDLLDIADQLRTLKLPVLIIRGEADIYLSQSICQTLHQEIPGSKLVRISTGGHLIQEDEPKQLLQHMYAFFKRA